MSRDGAFTEYALTPSSSPQRIVVGPDGALWFTELGANAVGRITVDGQVTEYPTGPNTGPVGITTVPGDDGLWFVEFNGNRIGRMATDGTVTDEFAIPSPASAPLQIAGGSARTLWFTESFLSPTGNKVGRLEPWGS
jgi:virginiamycin B lyase